MCSIMMEEHFRTYTCDLTSELLLLIDLFKEIDRKIMNYSSQINPINNKRKNLNQYIWNSSGRAWISVSIHKNILEKKKNFATSMNMNISMSFIEIIFMWWILVEMINQMNPTLIFWHFKKLKNCILLINKSLQAHTCTWFWIALLYFQKPLWEEPVRNLRNQ